MPADSQYPIPNDITIGQFADWSGTCRDSFLDLYSCRTSFELPFPSESLFLLSRGPVGGSANIIQSFDRTEDEGVVEVEVVAKYRQYDASDLARIWVCSIIRDDGGNGVGIFSQQWPNHVSVTFEVTMHLPRASAGRSSLHVKNLETDLPLFAHHTGDLADNVSFDFLSFKAGNVPIEVVSLYATNAFVTTSNSHIKGDFEISSSLSLDTSNSYIDVKVDLFNDEDTGVTDLVMSTSNAPINATLALISAVNIHSETGGKFKVDATTTLGSLDIAILRAPADSVLILDAHTSLSAATVKFPETYEGKFNATTTLWNRVDVEVDNTIDDPKGEGRRRIVDMTRGRESVAGTVSWGNGGRGRGRGVASVGTTMGPVTLKI